MKLSLQNISKRYNKDKYGLRDFSLEIENGIIGLLGPNGAGKSTLMKIIATISKPSGGLLQLDGHDLLKEPDYIRRILGYLPQDFGVYDNLNAYEFLSYIAAMKGVGGPNLKTRIADLLEGLNLTEAAGKAIGTYSGGMKQRVGIAQALLNDPKVLIFDEPTVGLDPEERMRFRNLISDLSQQAIVVLSSHIVSDIETIADEVAIMKDGALITKGSQEAVISMAEGSVYETTISAGDLAGFKQRNLVVNSMRHADGLKIRYISNMPQSPALAVPASLEDAYLFLTQKP
jgi:ABC-2 type transport system ATP-binding protein